MAKAFALQRSTAQPVTLDTVITSRPALGSPIAGMQITPLFPARCVNIYTVFGGDPYLLVLSAVGGIEVHRYVSGAWVLVAGPFTPAISHVLAPLCLHVVNDAIVAMWSDEGATNDGIVVSSSITGTSWSSPELSVAPIGSSNGGHSIVYRGAIWFATAIGLWCYAPLARFATLTSIFGTYTVGETVTGSVSLTTAVVRSFNSPVLRLDTVSGSGFVVGDVLTGSLSASVGTTASLTQFVTPLPDTGNDGLLTGATGPSNLIGTFASWDGILYFVQPKSASGSIRFYQLDSAWEATLSVPTPQWTYLTGTLGLVDAGFATVSADAGMWSLFVNKLDELCLFYSASSSTKLAKATSKALPLVFTDLTNTLLPSTIATKTSLGITLFTDDRRRDNILQHFLIRDFSGPSLINTTWDGTTSVEIKGSLPGTDFILPASRKGQEATFTNLQPACSITSTSQPFSGRLRIDYLVRSDPARTVDVIPEYSLDGDQWFLMTEGDGDTGTTGLSADPAGIPYFFNWDAFTDLDGDFNNMELRIVPRISGV
jgi:hypothetical protein